jgi:hypothetical protein
MKQTLSDVPDMKPGRDVARFGEDSFWKERYEQKGTVTFEWFVPFSDVLEQNLPFKVRAAAASSPLSPLVPRRCCRVAWHKRPRWLSWAAGRANCARSCGTWASAM